MEEIILLGSVEQSLAWSSTEFRWEKEEEGRKINWDFEIMRVRFSSIRLSLYIEVTNKFNLKCPRL